MKRISEYKALARKSTKNNYWIGATPYLIYYVLYSLILDVVTKAITAAPVMMWVYYVLFIIISAILIQPFFVGMSKFCLEQIQGRPDMKNALYSFRTNLTNIVKICFFRDIKVLLWMLIPVMIGTFVLMGVFLALGVFSAVTLGEKAFFVTEVIAVYVAILVLMIPGFIKSLEYSMIRFILAENEDESSEKCFKMTKEITDGKKKKLFLLYLSFVRVPIIVVAFSFLGVPILGNLFLAFMMPYMESTYAHFYLDVKAQAAYDAPAVEAEYEKIDDGDTFGI